MVTAAITIAVLTALASIANGIILITGGNELLKELLEGAGLSGVTDADLELAAQLLGYDSANELIDAYFMRGWLVAGAGALLLVFGLCMMKAATWARILVTISSVLVMLFAVVVLADETTPAMAGLALGAILGGILSIIFVWLPPVGRYKKALA
jgi:hypothetical protein